jgi:hypothetical protein
MPGNRYPVMYLHVFLPGMFTKNFIRDFRRCCWCTRLRMRKTSSEERLQGPQCHHLQRYHDSCGSLARRHEPLITVKSISTSSNHHNDKMYMDNSTCSSCGSGSRMRMSSIIVASPRFKRTHTVDSIWPLYRTRDCLSLAGRWHLDTTNDWCSPKVYHIRKDGACESHTMASLLVNIEEWFRHWLVSPSC